MHEHLTCLLSGPRATVPALWYPGIMDPPPLPSSPAPGDLVSFSLPLSGRNGAFEGHGILLEWVRGQRSGLLYGRLLLDDGDIDILGAQHLVLIS